MNTLLKAEFFTHQVHCANEWCHLNDCMTDMELHGTNLRNAKLQKLQNNTKKVLGSMAACCPSFMQDCI
jgi:hypothetical protein